MNLNPKSEIENRYGSAERAGAGGSSRQVIRNLSASQRKVKSVGKSTIELSEFERR